MLSRVSDLVTREKLRTWTRTPDIADDDDFATVVMAAASLKVRRVARHPEWTGLDGAFPAPVDAITIAEMLAARTYLNGIEGEISSSIAGAISTTLIREYAEALRLTDAEIETLEAFIGNEDGYGGGGLYLIHVTRGPVETTVALYDDSGSDWAIPWLDGRVDGYAL
jgi:hypothetical protein